MLKKAWFKRLGFFYGHKKTGNIVPGLSFISTLIINESYS